MRKILAMLMITMILLSGADTLLPRLPMAAGNGAVALAEDAIQPEEAEAEEAEEEEPEADELEEEAPEAEEPEEEAEAESAQEPVEDEAQADVIDEAQDEQAEEITDEAVAGAVEDVVVFSLVGEIDASWLAQWQEGVEQGVRVTYTMSASEYDELNDACRIATFGLKEIRALCDNESEQDLYHAIPSSGRTFTFHEDETDLEGDYVIPEAFLRALPDGEYEVYAVYGADGEEAIFGDISLTQPETAEETEQPEAVEAAQTEEAPKRSVQIAMSSVAGAVEESEEASEPAPMTRVLEATLTGFEDQEVALQWQCFDGTVWQDITGANETQYSFEVTEDNVNCQWRLKVTVPEVATA